MKAKPKPKRRNWILRAALLVLLLALAWALAGAAGSTCRLSAMPPRSGCPGLPAPGQLRDAIGVFGAAEYDGRPSPVYRARLDHALSLYHHGIAPLIITLGGNGGDQYNEGAVGREYLMGMGVPEQAIIAETVSRNTEESARRISRDCPRQRIAPAGHRQRRNAYVPHP
jgi:vancomycin permeability regulator SanA